MPVYKSSVAVAAKARMAKRARRQRFWKENKKRVTFGIIGFCLLVFLAFFTPLGPDYYYGKIQGRKMASPMTVSDGVLRDLYKLGVFYQYTMRSSDSLRIFNEMAMLYYGFTLTEYSLNPDSASGKRSQALVRIERGQGGGPPFQIADGDLKYMALAIWRTGEIIQRSQSRQFAVRLFEDLYLKEFMETHPGDLDPEITSLVQASVDRFQGKR